MAHLSGRVSVGSVIGLGIVVVLGYRIQRASSDQKLLRFV